MIERDYRSELELGLKALFGEHFLSYELRQERGAIPIFMLGQLGPMSVGGDMPEYTLIVNIDMNVTAYLKPNRLSHEDITIGNHGPISIDQYQDCTRARIVMRTTYKCHDLDDFLNIFKDKTWGKFDKEFTQQLEVKLDTGEDD